VSDDRLATVRIAVVRAWAEPEADPPTRIRITFGDATPGGPTTATAATAEELCAFLRRWLDQDAGDESAPGDRSTR
jgi:hypothetical protein